MNQHNTLALAEEKFEYMRELRRFFHKFPELSGEEVNTAQRISKELDLLGIPYKKMGKNSIVAELSGKDPSKTIALRADIDALPIQEATGAEYSSLNDGVMHACGHDSHAAMLLGAAAILSENSDALPFNVRLIFQESEETLIGAKRLIEEGVMQGVDSILGLHISPNTPLGSITFCKDAFMASGGGIEVTVKGESGHASTPHTAKNPILPLNAILTSLMQIGSIYLPMDEYLVMTPTIIKSGIKTNIIPDEAYLYINWRYFSPSVGELLREKSVEIATNIAKSYGMEAKVNYIVKAPPVLNESSLVKKLRQVVSITYPHMKFYDESIWGSEDFAYYQEETKGVFAFLGGMKDDDVIRLPHTPVFDIDENALPLGAAIYANFALSAL